ncbi:MAG TPA: ParB/RepB/Spo0J family partition protein [Pyrinomonadaceae bacterium]|jgi:ParB family chromosome partitioning protein|nr:ParB/RepB/Spo0J family partition protein [Pyrinomonadaceae bacterium]
MNRKALGRGLGALLSSDRTIDLGAETSEVDLDRIVPGVMQPRTNFDEAALESLAESIKTHGVVQPLLVRRRDEGFELIAGERRWRAAKLAGLTRVPVLVKDVADQNLLEIALIENIQREDLNPIEEAQAYKRLIETVGLTQEALATRVGRDRSYITNYLRLLKLPEDLQKLVIEGRLSTGHARTILGLTHADLQRRLARQVLEDGLSVRATEILVQKASADKAPRAPRVAQTVDPNIRAAETKLRRALGTQVRIVQMGSEGRGRVEISFYNAQDLDRVYDLLITAAPV